MAEPTTQRRSPGADADRRADGCDPTATKGLVSLGTGAAGIVAAVLPRLGLLALVLAALAIGVGVPAMRQGPSGPCFAYARLGVVLGMIAVLLGFLSLAIQLV